MRPITPLSRAASFPVTVGLGLAALAVSLSYWTGRDVTRLFVSERAFFAEPWRLLTTTLPHTDIVHLAFNLYWLWVFGTFIEEQLGALRLLGFVLVFAVVSSAAEFAAGSIGIGLSGVGYGLVGFLYGARRRDSRFADAIDARTTSSRGHAALVANHDAEALPLLERAVRLSPQEPTLWFNLGIAYQRLERHPESKRAYRRAAELEPTNQMYRQAAEYAAAH